MRAYVTAENSGNSYDAVFTALKLQDYAKSDTKWGQDYYRFWVNGVPGVASPASRVKNLPGFPNTNSLFWVTAYDSVNAVANSVLAQYNDSLTLWHEMARMFADTFTGALRAGKGGSGVRAVRFSFNDIVNRTAYEQSGTLFYDRQQISACTGRIQVCSRYQKPKAGS